MPRVDPNYKVGTVLERYDLLDLHEALPDLRVGEHEEVEPVSLRELGERSNLALLEKAISQADRAPLKEEAANIYDRLTSAEVRAGVRTQQRRRLQRAGVDGDQLEAYFVTHQAVHTYLTEVLDVSKDTWTDAEPAAIHIERIQRLRSRARRSSGNHYPSWR